MKYTKRNLHKLIGLTVADAAVKAESWFNRPHIVQKYNDFYNAIAVDRIILFISDDDDIENDKALVVLAGANDPTKFEHKGYESIIRRSKTTHCRGFQCTDSRVALSKS